MNVASPDLLTLLAWAERLAAGEPCAPWEAWSASAPDADWKWERISHAHDLLAGRRQADQSATTLPAEQLAEFIEGRLTASDLHRVEQACWDSTAQLAELVSTARFMRQPFSSDISPHLESRLLALVPQSKPQPTNGKPPKFRMAGVTESPPVASPAPAVTPKPAQALTSSSWQWPLIAAAMFIVIVLSGAVGWLAANWRQSANLRQEIVSGPSAQDLEPAPIDDRPNLPVSPQTRQDSIVPRSDEPISPAPSTDSPPSSAVESGSASPKSASPPSGTPKYRPRIAPPTPEIAIRSAQGLLLVDEGRRGKLRVAPASLALREPVNVLSLAESWTAADLPGVATFIWEGSAEAGLATMPDGTIEINLTHGRIGIDNLKTSAQLRIVSGNAAWNIRSMANNSTLAVVHDPRSPGLVVPRGALAINDLNVPGGQMIRWLDGAPQPPHALSSVGPVDSSQSGAMPPAMNPWEFSWLQPPDELSKKNWRTLYGRIADRLAETDDIAAELPKIMANMRDQRQAALVARWNIAALSSATRAQQIWTFLNHPRPLVRVAGVKSILEMPPGDERLVDVNEVLQAKVGAATTDRISQWLATAWQPGPPPKLQFEEMITHLMDNDLAVRQIAAALLELHASNVLRQARTPLPAYDATSSRTARQMAQAQWFAIMNKLYTPSRQGPTWANPPAAAPLKASSVNNANK